ncbi:hypothetical protein K435DRAFT_872385 [Dendrothele bispora CBS 962.96]|uniref:F-box domain-containing protein n=1 Tax=Dendrothele bispora (strain CBS 962.96) TaxID=1314807 RepID=A0A4S8L1S8_DENBC|nr:hypothetical protein K435DRAFT_872385 [Dendrothele bispora CBS 962.96]
MSQKRSSSQLEIIIMNPQAHIHKFPVEILTKIFKECCEMEIYLYKGVPAPLILAQVCRKWHRILIGPIIPSPRITSSSTPLPLSFTSTPTPTPTSTPASTPTTTPTTTAALPPPFQPWQHSRNPRLWSRLEFTLPSIDSEDDPHHLSPPPHVILNRISRYLALSSRPPISSSSSFSCSPSPCFLSPCSPSSSSTLPPVPLDITIKNGAARGPCDTDPIEMYARYPVRDDPYPEEVLDTLDAHVERIERLSMQVPWGWVWRWGRRGGGRSDDSSRIGTGSFGNSDWDSSRDPPYPPLPPPPTPRQALLLETFSMSITNDFPYPSTLALSDSDPDPGFLPILRTASNLTSLALRAWSGEMLRILDFLPLHWDRLVDLELKMVGTRETKGLMEMLREGRRLERVRVVVDEWNGDDPGDEGGANGGATTPWVLPCLKVLEIEFLRRVCTERFLEPFAFPMLEELVIKHERNSWGGGDMGGTLVGLMRRSHGSMWCGGGPGGLEEEEEDLSMPMSMLTTTLPLRKVELKFNQSSELGGKDLVEFVSSVSDTLTHLECSSYVEESATLLDALTASDARSVVIAPNLRELGITTGKYRQEEVDRLWEFIKSRWSEEDENDEDGDGEHQNDNDDGVENTVNSHRLTVPLHHFRLILTKDISSPVRRSPSWQNILLRTRTGRDRFVFQEKPRTLEQVHCQPRALSRGDTFDNLDCDSFSELEADKFWKGVSYSISRARGRSGMTTKGPRKLGDCYYEESVASTTSTSSRSSTPVASGGGGGGGGGGYGPGESESVSQPVYWTQSQSQSQSQSQTSNLGLGRRDSEISFTSLFTQERSRSRSVSRALALSREGTEEEVLTPRHDTTPRNSAGAPSRVGSTSGGLLRRSSTTSTLDLEFWNH